jgi:hypothetical protein
LTSLERKAYLIDVVKQVVANKIQGDIAECGVWRGGSMIIIARTLLELNDVSRKLYLYDTFEGMSVPTCHDTRFNGQTAASMMDDELRRSGRNWLYASIEDVQNNLYATGYPRENIIFVKGKVEDTIPQTLPERLSLLRLDTDWYESTKHELNHLFPLLVKNGILIVDDYGDWQGARKAVDEYLKGISGISYLHRVDYTGRALVKS